MTSRDDNTARRLDDLLDELQHGLAADSGDAVAHLHAVPDELVDTAQLLVDDADDVGHVPRDVAALRTRVLDGAIAHDRRHRRARLPRKARRFGRAPFARRALLPTMAVLVMCIGTTALAHTDTGVGSMVRTAARTLDIPVPPEAEFDAPAQRDDAEGQRGARGAAGDPHDADGPGDAGDARGSTDGVDLEDAPLGPDGQPLPLRDADGRPLGPDGQPLDGADGQRPPLGGDTPPLGDGQAPKPPLQDGQQPRPPLDDGQQPPQPKPEGQQPKPPLPAGETQPKPPLPKPEGQQPKPPLPAGETQAQPQQPAPQPAG